MAPLGTLVVKSNGAVMKEGLRAQLGVSLFVILVFLMGLGVGVLLEARLSGPGRLPPRGFHFARGRVPGQPPARPLVRHERRSPGRTLRHLGTSLDLSDEQTERLKALFQTQREQFGEVRRGMRQQWDTRREAFRTSIAEILTPAQMELFKKKARGRRGRANAGRRSSTRPR